MATDEIMLKLPACMFCNTSAIVYVTPAEYEALQNGLLVQDALPDRDADFRELFISGTHPQCWLGNTVGE